MREIEERRRHRQMHRRKRIAACMVALAGVAAAIAPAARAAEWRPSPGHVQVPIWPGTPPDQPSMPGPETAKRGDVTNVARPTMTSYAPSAKNTGVSVIVLPGGGFEGLAIDLEGTEICDWLTSRGITCVLLKYRVPSIPFVWQCHCRPNDALSLSKPSLQDV